MANIKNTGSVKLSNEGFADLFEDVSIYTVKAYISKKDNTIKFKIEKEEDIEIIKGHGDFSNYIKKFNTVVKNNKILDDDKVFFSSNSIYPRTAFNRYSKLARRIEKIEKASKIVVGAIPILYTRTFQGLRLHNKVIQDFSFNNVEDDIVTLIQSGKVSDRCLLKKAFAKEVRGYYGYSYGASQRLIDVVKDIFNKQFPKAEDIKFRKLEYIPTKFKGTFEIMRKGYPLTSFINDEEVSRYIDNFKEVIDEVNYPMLLSAFSGDNKQVTLAMKLVENMDTYKSKPYLYALFVNAIYKNRNTIINNKYYKSVGFNNLLKTFNIQDLVIMDNPYSGGEVSKRRLSYIQTIYSKKLKSNEDKNIFLTRVEDIIALDFKDIVGEEVYNLLITRKTL